MVISEIITSAGKFIKDISAMHVSNKDDIVDTYRVSGSGNNIEVNVNYDTSIRSAYRLPLSGITRYSDRPMATIIPNKGSYAGQKFYCFYCGGGGIFGEGVTYYVVKASDVQLISGGVAKALYIRLFSRLESEVA
ncbi:hypothetical protein [Lactobacillus hominis]|uniref:hypothetical protein n=2 Tax=Lactobacillus hominis TaxID=1203033 RepID=UPI0023F32E20|nr:hypothetical protein [Lactobacillus hominis]